MRTWIKIGVGVAMAAWMASSLAYSRWGGSFTQGYWSDENDIYGERLASRYDWDDLWFADYKLSLTGYYEAALGYWWAERTKQGENKSLWIFSAIPVFRVVPGGGEANARGIRPYFAFGVGGAYLSEVGLGDRKLSTHGQFEDRLGFGIQFGKNLKYELGLNFFHYSNAGVENPNNGIDAITVNVAVY